MEGVYIRINWSTAMHRSSSYQTLLRCYLDFISSWLIPFDPCRVSCILKLEKAEEEDVRTPSDVQGRGRPAGDYK